MLLFLAACTGTPDDTATGASITIVSPVEEAVICGTPLVVDVEVSGIVLVDPFPAEGTEPEPGTGHIDLALNGQEEDDWMFGGTQVVVDGIVDGYYQLKVELSYADHTPIIPYAGDLIYVTVEAAACD